MPAPAVGRPAACSRSIARLAMHSAIATLVMAQSTANQPAPPVPSCSTRSSARSHGFTTSRSISPAVSPRRSSYVPASMSLAPTPDDESPRRPDEKSNMEPKVGWLRKAMVLGQMGSRVKETSREVREHYDMITSPSGATTTPTHPL